RRTLPCSRTRSKTTIARTQKHTKHRHRSKRTHCPTGVDLIMSSFSGTISRVSNTRIFARATASGSQFLVYQMDYQTDNNNDLALIIPLPTPAAATADAVRFIDLSGYPEFFADIEKGFPFARGGVVPDVRRTKARPPANGAYDP